MMEWLLIQTLILFVALLLDMFLGEPPSMLHPVVWIGKLVARSESHLIVGSRTSQRLRGIFIPLTIIAFFTLSTFLFQWLGFRFASGHVVALIVYVIVSAYVLKASFTIFTLQKEALKVATLTVSDIDSARFNLRALVSRDRAHLDRAGILSSICESVGENAVDSIVAPLLFFAVFGITGAVCYRTVNTLDSMLGYRDHREHVGLFSARLDDCFNYIPTRVAVIPMLLSFYFISGKVALQRAWRTLKRDRQKKRAVNSGIPLALYAGGLGVRLEKPSTYQIGDPCRPITLSTVNDAVRATRCTAAITVAIVVLLLFIKSAVW
ncbi:MAG: adenosylcobinamide-phosphate synthase CbiB [Euryarchaeota archaeon]|nr:adenosylcobinamide-phosphate synthase CbiB [Euryarchaeota archaeon]